MCKRMRVSQSFGLLAVAVVLVLLGAGVSPAFAGDKEDILGRWDHLWSDASYFRFNVDGTFKRSALLGTIEGTYRFLSKDVIELNYPGTFYGRNVVEMKYRLIGDTLELKEAIMWIKYTRAK